MGFSCTCVFLKNNFISIANYKYVGVLNNKNYYDTKPCALLTIKDISDFDTLKEGDIVYYKTSIEKGTAQFVKVDKTIVTLKTDKGATFNTNKSSIVGVQKEKVGFWGVFVWFLTSEVGLVVATIALLCFVLILTFKRVNYENTEYGKYLLSEYKKWKKDLKQQKLLGKINGVESDFVQVLSGNFKENIAKFDNFAPSKKVSTQDKYKYILYNIHENLVEKDDLTIQEKRVISSIIELLGKAEHIDVDIEYMVIDLLLKSKLVSFETDEFIKLSNQFLEGDIDKQDLFNYGSIIYILVKKNPRLFTGKFKQLSQTYIKKASMFDEDSRNFAANLFIGTIKA